MRRGSRVGLRSHCGDSGSAMVEFALILPVFITLLLGMLRFGIAYQTQLELSTAAQEGARVMYLTNPPNAAAARDAVIAAARVTPALTAADVTVGGCSTISPGIYQRQVTARRTMVIDFYLGSRTVNIVGRGVSPCTP